MGKATWWGAQWVLKRLSLLLSQSPPGGGKCSHDIVSNWVDKGVIGSSEGFDGRSRMFANGMEKVAIGAMVDELWHMCGRNAGQAGM